MAVPFVVVERVPGVPAGAGAACEGAHAPGVLLGRAAADLVGRYGLWGRLPWGAATAPGQAARRRRLHGFGCGIGGGCGRIGSGGRAGRVRLRRGCAGAAADVGTGGSADGTGGSADGTGGSADGTGGSADGTGA
ncbi:hypothetical protein [Streptomyces sp. NBC_00443]|uniref:hypothetical protein n=1 Tax=Streptomyces sp. NBC_00443 TaxID=2975743 RepID=UPI002E1AA061